MLQLRLLGVPEVRVDGSPVTEKLPGKAQAILYYLALTGQPQPRTVLATLLWGDMPEAAARTNLRKALPGLRQELEAYLQIERQVVAFKPEIELWVDAVEFEAGVKAGSFPVDAERLQAAVELYQGDFLTGFYVRQAPDFEGWMLSEQARLRELVVQALHTLAEHQAGQGDLAEGIGYTRRLLILEPWREEAHRQLMLFLAREGQRSAALAQYESCRQILAEELGVEPGRETVALYERIRDGELSRGAGGQRSGGENIPSAPWPLRSPAPSPPSPPAPQPNLPAQPTPFVGRATELADIIRRLTDKDCHLLVLVGAGGIGKTRLAIQTAQTFFDAQPGAGFFGHGVVFVPLVAVESINGMVSAMAEAANFSFYSNVPPRQQLLDYLREKEMLLVLDNLEHLLSPSEEETRSEGGLTGAAELIAEILAAASKIKILVTSREALNLQEAWFHPVAGLSFPPPPTSLAEEGTEDKGGEGLEKYDAVQLFVQSAQRARVEFSLAAERAHVIRICQLVEGMPLALELAATWLKVLPVEKIATEIERNLDFLSTRHQNVSERHRSMQAVFDQSWQLLMENERGVLKRLSVFRGSFTEEAAGRVAEASLLILAVLVEKSLLRVTETGRYQLHELLRQFAGAKLAEDPSTESTTRERHSRYYLDFLKAREKMLTGKEQPTALAEIGIEIDNIRTGWRRAVEQGHIAAIEPVVDILYNFYEIRSRYQEGKEIFTDAITHLEAAEHLTEHPELENVLNPLQARCGSFHYFLGDYEVARQYLEASLNLASQPAEKEFILRMLGDVTVAQGKRSMAEAWFRQSLAISREMDNLDGVAEGLRGLAYVAVSFGDFAEGKQLASESLVMSRQLGQPLQVARALSMLAWVTNCLGAYREAEGYSQESLTICQEIGDRWGIANSLSLLGWTAWCEGAARLAEAVTYYKKALAICREIGYRRDLAMYLGDLVLITGEMGDYEQAMQYGREGLAVAEAIGHLDLMAYNLYCLGAAACGLGDFQASRDYLLKSLQVAWEAQIIDHTTIALFYWTMLLAKESDLADVIEPIKSQQKARALEVLTFVIHHPSTWQAIKDRAVRLQTQLEAELPAEVVATAITQAENRTLEATVAEILQS